MILTKFEKKLLDSFLKQDNEKGDITSALIKSSNCQAEITSGQNCTLSGIQEISYLFKKNGLRIKIFKTDGDIVKKGQKILEIKGNNKKILMIERTALNILSRMSGVTTLCKKAKKIAGKTTTIALTRKTMPGLNLFDKKAAKIAGIWEHRKNLSDAVLIKDNHLVFEQDFEKLYLKAKKQKKRKFIEIEVDNLNQLKKAIDAGFDYIMLDNFSITQAKKAITFIRKQKRKIHIEISGGINLIKLKKYAKLKPNIISMGLLTSKAEMLNFGLAITKVF